MLQAYEGINESKFCVQILVDVMKAFVRVDHDILLHVMNVAVRLFKLLLNIDFAPIRQEERKQLRSMLCLV